MEEYNLEILYLGQNMGVTQKIKKIYHFINTKKYHVFAPMGRFQLELSYLYFPPSSHQIYVCFCPVGLSLL